MADRNIPALPKRFGQKGKKSVQATKPSIRRLAFRGGVKRISGVIYEESHKDMQMFLEQVLAKTVLYTEHARRGTVTTTDVIAGLKKAGKTMYR